MNCKFIKKTKGAIAVFLTLIMLGMVVFEGVLIDTSRLMAAKTVTSGAGDLALNSAMTNYDKVLYEVYGLFATAKDEADLEVKVNEYFNRTLQGAGIDGSLEDISNMLNLVVTSGGSVSLTGVPGSELTNSDVIGNQILEYMKFRAPVNIGFGFLEKIESFKDFNKQTEAMEAQMDFEEKLESLQDALQKVYDKANELKAFDITKPTVSDSSFNPDMDYRYKSVDESISVFNSAIAWYVKLNWAINKSIPDGSDITDEPDEINGKSNYDYNWKDDAERYSEYFDRDALMYFIENKRESKSDIVSKRGQAYLNAYNEFHEKQLAVAQNKAQLATDPEYYKKSELFKGYYNALDNCKNTYNQNLEMLQQLYCLLRRYERWYQLVGSDIQHVSSEEELKENEEFHNKYAAAIEQFKTEMDNNCLEKLWNSSVDYYEERMINIYDSHLYFILNCLNADAEEGAKKADELVKAIDCGRHKDDENNYCCLSKAIDCVENEKDKWQGKISALSDGSTKTSMQGTFDAETKGIDKEQYKDILSIANSARTYYIQMAECVKKVTIEEKDKYWEIYNIPGSEVDFTKVYNYKKDNESVVIIRKTGTKPTKPSESVHIRVDKDKFYQYLKNICAESDKKEDSGDKKASKGVRDKLFEKGNNTDSQKANDSEIGKVDEGQWSNVESIFSSGGGDDVGSVTVNRNDNNKETTKNAKNSLNSTKDLLGGIGNILLAARDGIYYTEYATGMFSCYTTGVDKKSTPEDESKGPIWTIAGEDNDYYLMSKEYNRMWRAEQEYILWGNHNAGTNVNNTLALIFGIRFALNLLYAFTGDAEIEITTLSWATAIAGWTCFGVPIVQTVLKIALALAETTCDLVKLKDGEDVVLYKTNNTWVMKPGGLTKETVDTVANAAKDVAVTAVDTAFNYVDKVATENINKVTSGVANTVEQTQKSIVDSAVNYIMAPFGKTFVALVGQTEADINGSLNKILNDLKSNASKDSSALGKLECYLLDNYGSEIVSTISSKVSEVKGDATKKYDELVKGLKDDLIKKANASSIVTGLGNELSNSVHTTLQSLNEDTKVAVGDNISKSVSGFLNEAQGYGTGDKASVTRGFAITMNYQEYLHMFLILYGASKDKQDVYLSRIAQLIQLNMSMDKRKGSDFSLAKKYTMLQIKAEVDVNTFFFGKLNSFLENPVDAKAKYTLEYRSLQGY